MTPPSERKVTVERIIDADPQRIFDVLADPARHHAIDGSDSVNDPILEAPERLGPGSRFSMRMRTRPREFTRAAFVQVAVAISHRGQLWNKVVEFEEPHRIAWHNFGNHVWRYELEPIAPSRTLVRETFDYSTNIAPWLLEWARFPDTNHAAMQLTLDRLAEVATIE